ncbi:S-layer homology domain-containing protein [Nodosilinea sp. E11]|uniref:S-layer homology domain-containing protein n=1 Tax=Nodosilinea sp. E11 TaxID=3037479 RepID=UPI002935146B|nr:S-layer homology domain-containing protein [Nodosilinea sp. E11]WOD37561.1 S-layer homology domain-containing protein [Nodosilinea sp. E11]
MSAALRLMALMVSGLGLLLATGCAGSQLQQSLEADPQLQDRPVFSDEEPEVVEPVAEAEPEDSTPRGDGSASTNPPPRSTTTALLAEVPDDLRPYVQDWLALGVVERSLEQPASESAPALEFQPNETITRAEFAHWLLTANNQFYQDVPAKRIRAARGSADPAFQDVPASHPHFAAIQGLAEAGIIPSAKSGNATAVTFRPDAPLTRETLVLWKVPLDTRAPLPTANAEAVTTAWGFQDTSQVEPLALRAVLADHQNGDFANIRRAFGYTTLLQPQKGVTQAEAAAVLWRFGDQTEGISAKDLLRQSSPPSGSPAPSNSTDSL